jgi:hypothetical protein
MRGPLLQSLAIPALLVLPATVLAQEPRTPPTGSAERREIMDVLRAPCERDLGQKVIFKVNLLNVVGDWGLARVVPSRPNGQEIDYRKTKYREAFEAGMFDGEGEALLRKKAGAWTLREWRFGATDTEVMEWIKKYRIPKSILNE